MSHSAAFRAITLTTTPITRNSLILRIRDRDDAESWREFVSIYEPVIHKTAMRRGMQHADASELVQRVLLAVARAVDRFEPDQDRARFRTWLYRITHNEFCKQYSASRRLVASGDSKIQEQLTNIPNSPDDEMFITEYRRSVFRWAAKAVQPTVRPSTWQAFHRTGVEGESVESVAEQLGLTVGAVYVARSRVMAKLRQVAATYDAANDSEESRP